MNVKIGVIMKKKLFILLCLTSLLFLTACGSGTTNAYTTVNRWGYESISEEAVYDYELKKPTSLAVGINLYYPVGEGTYTTTIESIDPEEKIEEGLLPDGAKAFAKITIDFTFTGRYVNYKEESGAIVEVKSTEEFTDSYTTVGYFNNNLQTIAVVKNYQSLTTYPYLREADADETLLEKLENIKITTKYFIEQSSKFRTECKIEGDGVENSHTFQGKTEQSFDISGYVFDNDLLFYHIRSIRELDSAESYSLSYQLFDYTQKQVNPMVLSTIQNTETESKLFNYPVENDLTVNGESLKDSNLNCIKVTNRINKTQSGSQMTIYLQSGDKVNYVNGNNSSEIECKKILKIELGNAVYTLHSYTNKSATV